MSRIDQYRSELRQMITRYGPDPALIPMLLVQACLPVIPADGAGLSLTSGLGVPLAASSPEVTIAEQLQTTLGDGPCLTAASTGRPLTADENQIAAQWPIYHAELTESCSYRSVCSLPLTLPGSRRLTVLDLYSTDPTGNTFAPLDQLRADICIPIAGLLAASLDAGPGAATSPGWLNTDPARDRMSVWTAVGILMSHLNTSNDTALAILRGYAYRTHTNLDDLAHQLIHRQLQPEDITTALPN